MNDISSRDGVIFQNPEHKPLEDLKLVIKNNGIAQTIPALDEHWVEKKSFLNYEAPNLVDSEGRDIIGSKERWLELACFILDDLSWLLHLPFYKFWSNIVYNPSIMDSVITFLQEAPMFYTLENFPNDYDIKEHFNRIRQNVLILFARLVTNKESPTEYITLSEYADLLYNKYIFTVPILMDLCQQYGRDNKKVVEKIVNSVFTVKPLYKEDLEKAVSFVIQVLRDIEKRFEDCPIYEEGKAVPLSERGGANVKITLSTLEDMILYLLDTVSTISIFIEIYPPCINNFKVEHFITKIVSVYGNTIPEMYKRLNDLAFRDESIAKYMELKHLLDVTRIEILNVYRNIIYKNIEDIVENRSSTSTEIGEIVEDFLTNLHTLSEKEFVIDYHNLYPITDDFQTLIEIYPDLDTVKCEFIINSIFTFLDESTPSMPSTFTKTLSEPTAGPSNVQNNRSLNTENEPSIAGTSKTNSKSEVELASLISEVKDILCDLGEGFIEKCLKYYDYNKESVINAVLEDSLPTELKHLDRSLPYIPPDPEEASATINAALGIERLNVFDNDEFDIMTNDHIDTSKVHRGKRKDKYKNLNDLLNDKSHIAEIKNRFSKYNLVSDDYNDEYDDTYDDQDIGSSAQDDVIETDARPFTIPRVLRKQVNDVEEIEEENNSDFRYTICESENQVNRDEFVQDPALLRAKAEERRRSKQGIKTFPPQNKNVVGNPKGQGQTKDVLDNRNQKNKNKATKANHNRRTGSQWKRNQGMVPS